MNPGELRDRINILSLGSAEKGEDRTYSWQSTSSIWSKAEKQDKNNLFSSVGLGAKSITFTIRKRSLSLHDAISWESRHCFLTDITEVIKGYLEVKAALIAPKVCSVRRTTTTKDALNRPVEVPGGTITFPGCLTEKYYGHSLGQPMAEVETRLVLVTPKVIELVSGEVVEVDQLPYVVLTIHTLDEYKNEYEIERRHNP